MHIVEWGNSRRCVAKDMAEEGRRGLLRLLRARLGVQEERGRLPSYCVHTICRPLLPTWTLEHPSWAQLLCCLQRGGWRTIHRRAPTSARPLG